MREDYQQDGKLRAADEQDIIFKIALNQVEENGAPRLFLCFPNGKIVVAKLLEKTIARDLRLSL